MPRVTLVYSVEGYITREYEVEQEIIDRFEGPDFMHLIEQYVYDRGLEPVFERDRTTQRTVSWKT